MRSNRRRSHRLWPAVSLAVALVLASSSTALAAGKPGYPDKFTWSGATWAIKTSRSPVGPGPNTFSKANVSVDGQGRLHLSITQDSSGAWTAAEIVGSTTYGYGTYTFTIDSPVGALDPNVVLGLFTWSDKARFAHREIDIEFGRWGVANDPTNAQYVAQPYDAAGHLVRFTQPADTTTTHQFSWQPGRIDWQSRTSAGAEIGVYTYQGSDVPPSGDETVRLNLWLVGGAAPTDGRAVEVIITSLTFAR